MDNKLLLIGAVILVFIGILFALNTSEDKPTPTGGVICDAVPATSVIVGDNFCIGKKSWLGILKDTCTVKVQNLENQPADFSVLFNCFTVENPTPVKRESDKQALSGGETGSFTIKFDTDGREWRCDILSVEASKVNSCIKQ